tara:strand:+ start:510 stop:1499 length:990 start_codon:yes stop_codon:yes gene_type:complete
MDYYEILGIERDATKIDIKKAYHKLAIIWHPDKNNSKEAKSKFQQISEAYQVLYNEDSRTQYDYCGKTDFNIKSPEELFNELFNDVDPIISRFLKSTFSDLKNKFNKSEKVNLWDLFTTIDKDTLIEEGGNVVKHILKRSLTDNTDSLVESKYTYELKLDINDIDKINSINLTLDCVRRYTHIKILIPNSSSANNSYILDMNYEEHIINYDNEKYTFYLIDDFPQNYKRSNGYDLVLEHSLSFKYQQCGYYLSNEFVDNERLEINLIFNNKCNIVQIPGKGILNKKSKKLGNLYIILTYDDSEFDISNKDMPEKPVYYTMNPYDLIEKI